MAARDMSLGLNLVRTLARTSYPAHACPRAAQVGLHVRSLTTRSAWTGSVRASQCATPRLEASTSIHAHAHSSSSTFSSSILTLVRFNSTSTRSPSTSPSEPDERTSAPSPPSPPTPALPSDSLTHSSPVTAQPVPAESTEVAKKDEKDAKPDVASIVQLLRFAKPQWKLITVGVVCLVISTGVNLAIPWVIGRIIDFFAPGSEQTLLFGLPIEYATAALAIVLLLGAAANSGRSIALRLSGQRTAAMIRNKTYTKYMSMPPSHIETSGVGDALSRLGQDTSIVGQSLSENLGEGLKAVLGAGAGIVAMWLISPTLTLVMLFVIPPISVGSFFYGRFIRTLSLKTQEAMGGMSKLAEERLSAHRTVTASNTQPSEQNLFAGKVDSVYQLQKKETYANGIFQGANEAAGDLGIIGLLLYGGVLMKRGEISVGDMTALFIYVNWIEWSLNSESRCPIHIRHISTVEAQS